jgi:hypothetical protein
MTALPRGRNLRRFAVATMFTVAGLGAAESDDAKYRKLCAEQGLVAGFLTGADVAGLRTGLKIGTGFGGEERFSSGSAFQNIWLISEAVRERTYRSRSTGDVHQYFDADGAQFDPREAISPVQVMLYYHPARDLDSPQGGGNHDYHEGEYRKLLGGADGWRACGPLAVPDAEQFVVNGVFRKSAPAGTRLDRWDGSAPGDEFKIFLKRKGAFWLVQLTVSGVPAELAQQRQQLLAAARQADFARVSNRVVAATSVNEALARQIGAMVARKLK